MLMYFDNVLIFSRQNLHSKLSNPFCSVYRAFLSLTQQMIQTSWVGVGLGLGWVGVGVWLGLGWGWVNTQHTQHTHTQQTHNTHLGGRVGGG